MKSCNLLNLFVFIFGAGSIRLVRARRLALITGGLLLALGLSSARAVNISAGSTVSESFSIGTSATAALPTDWRADKQTTARVVGTYSAAGTATEQRAGNDMSPSAANGIYNYGAGVASTATDRAVGFISSSSATKTGNLYVKLVNNGATAITSLSLSYNVEKYRDGSNTAGFQYQLYYSTDGSTWTSAGSDFLTTFTGDADSAGFIPAPGLTKSVSSKTLAVTVAAGGTLYLCWSYSVQSGSTTSNAQGLGIDDVSITANGPASCTSPTTSFAVTGGGSFCAGGSGVAVGLSGSQSGVTYQLYKDAAGTGQTVAGTGSAISFGNQTAAGTYTVWSTAAGGYCVEQMIGSPSSVSVSINALPTITLGSHPAVCQGATSASLTYSATTGSPDQYSLDFDSTAEGEGFADVVLSSLPSSQITITVPGAAAAGTYTAALTVKNTTTGCVSGNYPITVKVNAFSLPGATTTVFSESMGTPGSTTLVSSYAGWQNSSPITFLSSTSPESDVRITSASSGYDGASGGGNVFMGTATANARDFIIGGINTVGYASLQLQFGVRQDVSGGSLAVEISTDGTTWTALSFAQPDAVNTWYLRAATGTIPAASNLRIRFSKNSSAQFRIDDIKLNDAPRTSASASISAGGPTMFCAGGAVTLTATAGGTHYNWFKDTSPVGTDSVTHDATASGSYTVVVTDDNGCTSTSAGTTVTVNDLPAASDAAYTRGPGASLKIKIADLTPDTIQSLGPASHGTVSHDGTHILYLPSAGDNNNDSFTYTAVNTSACTKQATITVTVVPATGQAQTPTVPPGGPVTVGFAGIPNYPYQAQRATNVDFTIGLLRTWNTNAPGAGVFQIEDDFSDLGQRPSAAWYRLKYNP